MKKILIVGAGVAGEELLEELRKHKNLGVEVAGFVDDDPKKRGKKILDLKILGDTSQLKDVIKDYEIDEVFIAIPSASGKKLREIISSCASLDTSFRVIPRALDIIQGKVIFDELRKVEVEDLIGREIVQLDQKPFEDFFKGKTVMVTGACGSIGSEITRQLSQFKLKELILYDWWENGMFYLLSELKPKVKAIKVTPIIGDIKDEKKLNKVFLQEKINIVFHAAAYKHVPLMEENPSEAVKNNVLGTFTLGEVSRKNNIENFVFISTDKAVRPKNIMGATKLIAEGVISNLSNKGKTKFVSVRFGNVLDSFGSVLPLFKKQISEGGPVTVTHKEAKRFFMSIPEAVQLIFKAVILGNGGEIFMLDMGEQIKILDLARLLIKLSGYTPEKDIKIIYTGLRPGEKIEEELFTNKENLVKTENDKIFITRNLGLDVKSLNLALKDLIDASIASQDEKVSKILKKIVPTLNI